MPSSESSTVVTACPQCSKALRVDASLAGRRGKCGACGHAFRIAVDEPSSQPPPQPPAPKHVSFNCELCETRMTVAVAQVGRKAKCPDCGRLTVVPPPPAPRAPVIPAAMFGDQYDVWGPDETPTPEDMAAYSPPAVAVTCRLCGTLMHAGHDQIGAAMTCPDCGVTTTVEAPAVGAHDGVQPSPSGDEYELDAASAPTPRPVPKIVAVLDAQRHAEARARQDNPKRKPDAATHGYGSSREQAPRVPLVQGAASMLCTMELFTRWLTLSTTLLVVQWFAAQGAGTIASKMGAIMALCFLALAIMLGVLWFLVASAVWVAVLTESADGHRRLHNPPSMVFTDWFGDAAFVFVAAVGATLPAGGATYWLPLGPEAKWAAAELIWLAAFPVLLLSALDEATPMGVFSPRVWATLVRRPLHWALFYVLTAAVFVAAALPIIAAPAAAVWIAAPLAIAASLAYFRLIGLQGWWLAESLATPAAADETPS